MATTERQMGIGMHSRPYALFSYVWDYVERCHSIKLSTPPEEQERYLLLFRLIPRERLPVPLLHALAAWEEAGDELETAGDAWGQALAGRDHVLGEWDGVINAATLAQWAQTASPVAQAAVWAAQAAVWATWAQQEVAGAALEKARAEWNGAFRVHTPELLALHAELCPGCPWNGTTIFPESRR